MKKLLPLFLFAGFYFSLNAQGWVRPNATWHFSWSSGGVGGAVTVKHTGDTLIENRETMKFESKYYDIYIDQHGNYHQGGSGGPVQRNYTTVRNDTVFYWTNGAFEILYDLTPTMGQTWDLGSVTLSESTCSDLSSTEVKSVNIALIGGVTYKSFDLESPYESFKKLYGKFNSRFGPHGQGVGNFVFPTQSACSINDESAYYKLICFQDDALLYNPDNIDCDYMLTLDLNSIASENKQLAFPNPTAAGEIIHVKTTGSYSIFDNAGRKIQQGEIQDMQISTQGMETGNYLLIIQNAQGISKQLITLF